MAQFTSQPLTEQLVSSKSSQHKAQFHFLYFPNSQIAAKTITVGLANATIHAKIRAKRTKPSKKNQIFHTKIIPKEQDPQQTLFTMKRLVACSPHLTIKKIWAQASAETAKLIKNRRKKRLKREEYRKECPR